MVFHHIPDIVDIVRWWGEVTEVGIVISDKKNPISIGVALGDTLPINTKLRVRNSGSTDAMR